MIRWSLYGPWWVASYQPFFWYPPAYFGYPVHWHRRGHRLGQAVPGRSKPLGLGSSGVAGGQDRRDHRPQRIFQPPAVPQLPRQRFVAARARAPAWRRLWKSRSCAIAMSTSNGALPTRGANCAPACRPPRLAGRRRAGAAAIDASPAPQTAPGYRQAPAGFTRHVARRSCLPQAPPDQRAPRCASAQRRRAGDAAGASAAAGRTAAVDAAACDRRDAASGARAVRHRSRPHVSSPRRRPRPRRRRRMRRLPPRGAGSSVRDRCPRRLTPGIPDRRGADRKLSLARSGRRPRMFPRARSETCSARTGYRRPGRRRSSWPARAPAVCRRRRAALALRRRLAATAARHRRGCPASACDRR